MTTPLLPSSPSTATAQWTVIKFLRDCSLPRFKVFAGETWTTRREVGDTFDLGAGTLALGRDYEVTYTGERRGARAYEAAKTIRRCEYHRCKGCVTCGGAFAA